MRPATRSINWEVHVWSETSIKWLVTVVTENDESALDTYGDMVRRGNTVRIVKVTTTRQTVKVNQ